MQPVSDCPVLIMCYFNPQVQSQTLMVDMVPKRRQTSKSDRWSIFREKTGVWGNSDFIKNGFVDHINTTKDSTDYLWHTTRLVYIILFSVSSFRGE
jgi:hypothetical protein